MWSAFFLKMKACWWIRCYVTMFSTSSSFLPTVFSPPSPLVPLSLCISSVPSLPTVSSVSSRFSPSASLSLFLHLSHGWMQTVALLPSNCPSMHDSAYHSSKFIDGISTLITPSYQCANSHPLSPPSTLHHYTPCSLSRSVNKCVPTHTLAHTLLIAGRIIRLFLPVHTSVQTYAYVHTDAHAGTIRAVTLRLQI